jgi:hypothetical protein
MYPAKTDVHHFVARLIDMPAAQVYDTVSMT